MTNPLRRGALVAYHGSKTDLHGTIYYISHAWPHDTYDLALRHDPAPSRRLSRARGESITPTGDHIPLCRCEHEATDQVTTCPFCKCADHQAVDTLAPLISGYRVRGHVEGTRLPRIRHRWACLGCGYTDQTDYAGHNLALALGKLVHTTCTPTANSTN
jgi:hypothetical protein